MSKIVVYRDPDFLTLGAVRTAEEAAERASDAAIQAAFDAAAAVSAASVADGKAVAAADAAAIADGKAVVADGKAVAAASAAAVADGKAVAAAGKADTALAASANSAVLSSIAELRALPITVDGRVARVIGRQAGYFKWRAGDLTAAVASDPYGGLWVASNSAPNGASGAWQRMVEGDVYDTEWWLPDVMPVNAQMQINSAINALPITAGRLILPRREVFITNSIRLTKGIIYEGFGAEGRINGQGGLFHAVRIQASNALLKRVASGNVAGGQINFGEPCGFHINDGADWNNQFPEVEKISNVGLEACEAYDVETGLRFGYSSANGYPNPGSTVAASHDCWATDFRGTGVNGVGIEYFHAYDIEVRNPRIKMKGNSTIGFARGMRLANAKRISVIGGSLKGPKISASTCHGLSCESASMVTFDGVRLENFSYYLRSDNSQEIIASNCQAIGWDGGPPGSLFAAEHRDGKPSRNINISDCTAVNISVFLRIIGEVHGLTACDNYHIDGDAGGDRHFMVNDGNGIGSGWLVRGNRHISGGPSYNQGVRIASWPAGCEMTLDDNIITGSIFAAPGDGVVRTRNSNSNRRIDTSLWSTVRPSPAEEDY